MSLGAAGEPGAPEVLGLLVMTPQPEPPSAALLDVSTHPALLCWREAPSVWEEGTRGSPALSTLGGDVPVRAIFRDQLPDASGRETKAGDFGGKLKLRSSQHDVSCYHLAMKADTGLHGVAQTLVKSSFSSWSAQTDEKPGQLDFLESKGKIPEKRKS